jgi:DNA (cytosine-5)-methyltransferase 1
VRRTPADLQKGEHVPGQLHLPLAEDVTDLFAGPGGWDEGMRPLGLTAAGIEWDRYACATARAAGHRRIRADVADLDPRRFVTRGQVASPPCQGFSPAGLRRGHGDTAALLDAVARMRWRDVRGDVAARMADPRSVLVLEPLRWARAVEPEWLAWEQVASVLPLWDACAGVLRAVGYDVATGVLSAEQYGVPQVRRRAFLVARQFGGAVLPAPTHARYDARDRSPAGEGLLPWVSMAQALGWGMTRRPYPTVAPGTKSGGQDTQMLGGSGARAAVHRELDAGRWLSRPIADDPALTLFDVDEANGSADPVGGEWLCGAGPGGAGRPRHVDHPAPTIAGKGTATWVADPADWYGGGSPPQEADGWPFERPATTVQGDPRVWPPGHKINGDDVRRLGDGAAERYGDRAGTTALRVTVREAGLLQGFRADYPWCGSATEQYQQIGNAVPPPLARAVVAAVAHADAPAVSGEAAGA